MEQGAIWEYYQTEGMESFAGSAARLRFLARKFAPRDKVLDIGIDPSERAIDALRERLGMSVETAVTGYAQRIRFPDGFFDGVVMSEVLEHLADTVLAER